MTLPIHCLCVRPRLANDPRSRRLRADAQALGLTKITALQVSELYFIEGVLTANEQMRLESELLSDPVAQTAEWRTLSTIRRPLSIIEVALRPGVTDPVAEQIVRAAHELGIMGVKRAATGQRYEVRGKNLQPADLHALARGLLANSVIQHYALGPITPHFPQEAEASQHIEIIPVRELTDEELLTLSRERRAALDLAEMQAIQNYFRAEGRDPTDVEFEMLAQTWSEHCVHKTFKAKIQVAGWQVERSNLQPTTEINGILKTYLRAATEQINAPWVRSAFVDNAGIIDFDAEHEISFKVETHNHPSAIEPFGGANTGVGGVIRDVLGVSAKPIAATDVLCFGPADANPKTLPNGVLHPRRIRSGVVAGIQDYGNKIGLPTVNGAIVYDEGYTANPLVFCGCVGLAPKNKHPRAPQTGDRIIVLGGRTGRDGLRGATFSSMTMDAQTGEVAGASVQIGDPITEKGLIEVIMRARDEGLYHAITDCGAGGLSSAVGEMASSCGGEVDLSRVKLKYSGLAPWEIWLSEAQERMVLAAPPESVERLQAICATFDVEWTDIGVFNQTGRLVVRAGEKLVLDLANEFLHDGLPQRKLTADIRRQTIKAPANPHASPFGKLRAGGLTFNFNEILLKLLSHPTIASKADVIRVYDHEVQGGTVVKPLTGVLNDGPSDACVLKPAGTKGLRGVVLSNGLNPQFGKQDAYRMAVSAADEAIRNAVAVGADPSRIAILDNFCWGNPKRPETLGTLVEAARGCYDAALHYSAPFISGKDSLNNEYLGTDGQRHAIPPTLLISAIGIIDDVTQAVTMDLKQAGNAVYLLGETKAEFGGSHLAVISEQLAVNGKRLTNYCLHSPVPSLPQSAPAIYKALHAAIQNGLVRACHDLSEGGLAVAAAEMCIGGRLGLALTLDTEQVITALFSESNGRLLVEVQPEHSTEFERLFAGLPYARVGIVTGGQRLTISARSQVTISLPVEQLVSAWQSPTTHH